MRVEQVWRYPVKSVGGELLRSVPIDADGPEHDRRIAVLDDRDEVTWAGAIPGLMQVRATLVGPGVAQLRLPGGELVRTDAPDAGDRLSAAVGAKVRLAPHGPNRPTGVVNVLTTTSLASLAAALPDSVIDPTRFRPNLVLADVPGPGYPEQEWLGRTLVIGTLRLRFAEVCDRCVMITKETPTAPHDKEVLRWVARELGNAFGILAAVDAPGVVSVGDEAHWAD